MAKHNSPSDCWVVLYGQVYDLTPFLPQHPGGSRSILALAGQDATIEYDAIHPPGTLEEHLPAEARIGNIDPKSVPRQTKELRQPLVAENDPRIYRLEQIEDCLNLDDIEALATRRVSRKAWAYYYSASNDSLTKSRNTTVYQKVLLRPRVLINVTRCDTSTGFLDRRCQARVPFYVAPAAMARLAHTAGEAGIAQACKRYGVLQIISNNASQTPEQIVAGNLSEHRSDTGSRDDEPEQVFGWQLYEGFEPD